MIKFEHCYEVVENLKVLQPTYMNSREKKVAKQVERELNPELRRKLNKSLLF